MCPCQSRVLLFRDTVVPDVSRRMEGCKSVLAELKAAVTAAAPQSPAAQNPGVQFVQRTLEDEVALMEFQTELVSGRRDVRARRGW